MKKKILRCLSKACERGRMMNYKVDIELLLQDELSKL